MPAKWNRLNNVPQETGQMQAVRAKKHVTVFMRSPSAPGAGRPEVKQGFTKCAHQTAGIANRMDRNVKLKECLKGTVEKLGVAHRRSRSKGHYGQFYHFGPTGEQIFE